MKNKVYTEKENRLKITKKDVDVLADFMATKYKKFILVKKDSMSTRITADGFEFEFLFNGREMAGGASVRFFFEDNPALIHGMVQKRPIMVTAPYQYEMLREVEDFLEKVQEI
ncbi:MAG: hypothetical protein KHZ78_05400 [Peptoniphilus sp. oral taxon 375]|nr:hypothetical protein [Peptoniphilus sp. oral taxon 375]